MDYWKAELNKRKRGMRLNLSGLLASASFPSKLLCAAKIF